jgi:anthranilate phosphoribosyltransferase
VLKDALSALVEHRALTRQQTVQVFEEIFSGGATPAQLAAFMVALRMKGESAQEIAGAAEVMRRMATPVRTPPGRPVLDTCGTGGDGAHTVNISTMVAFVVAAAGVTVAKHGNRSVSSKCGSADVLEACGVRLDVSIDVVERCIREVGIGFLFAPSLHGVMKHVAGPRREIGLRSIFNLLGPLSNPAGADRQLLGVYAGHLVPIVAETLVALGTRRALVVHGHDGLDEISPAGPTRAALVDRGTVVELTLTPEDAGARSVPLDELRGGAPSENARRMETLLGGGDDPASEAVCLNAGAALWVAGVADDLRAGVVVARRIIDEGKGLATLRALIGATTSGEASA